MERFDAVILAGGTGRRLGGLDKAGLLVGGATLLDRVLAACREAGRVVVVGSPRPTAGPAVLWAREQPAGGGPLAGLAAGLDRLAGASADGPQKPDQPDGAQGPEGLPAPVVVVLATDLPWLRAGDVDRLRGALAAHAEAEAAVFTDAQGRLQPLAAAYRAEPLRAALAQLAALHGRPVRLVLARLAVLAVPDSGAAADCDTPAELAAARSHFETQG